MFREILTLRLSGSSVLPAYPGFMVINTAQDGFSTNSTPSKMNLSTYKVKEISLQNSTGNNNWYSIFTWTVY